MLISSSFLGGELSLPSCAAWFRGNWRELPRSTSLLEADGLLHRDIFTAVVVGVRNYALTSSAPGH
jgi:hypothetical protein